MAQDRKYWMTKYWPALHKEMVNKGENGYISINRHLHAIYRLLLLDLYVKWIAYIIIPLNMKGDTVLSLHEMDSLYY